MTGNPVITCHIILVCQVITFTLVFSVSRSDVYRFFVLDLRLARGEQDVIACSKFRISKGIRRFHRLSKCLACCVNRHACWLFCGKVVSSFSKSRKRRQHETDTPMVPLKQPLMLRHSRRSSPAASVLERNEVISSDRTSALGERKFR